jgi:mono/diheme cytochrome c family protein
MADVVRNSTSHLTDADIAAIAAYLKTVPGQAGAVPTPIAANDPAMTQGAKIYQDECSSCHTGAGTGKPGIFPALIKNPAVQAEDPVTLMRVVLQGAQGVGTVASPTAPGMPAFGGLMSDQQIAAVLTYIRNSWGNAAPSVGADAVSKARQSLSGR